MFKLFNVLAIVLSVIIFISCQKEIKEEIVGPFPIPPAPPTEIDDSILLSKIIGIKTTSGSDTTVKYDISYDISKRLIKIKALFPDDPTDTYEEERFYRENDSLPYKITIFWDGGVYDTLFLTYENGVVKQDSLVSHEKDNGNGDFNYSEVFTFSPAGNNRYFVLRKLYSSDYFTGNKIVITDSIYCIRNIQNRNEISGTDSIFNVNNQMLTVVSYQNSFDDNPNPLKQKLILPYPVITQALLDGHVFTDGSNGNNFASTRSTILYSDNSEETYSTTFSYQYRNDGFPVVVNSINSVFGNQKILYFYTN